MGCVSVGSSCANACAHPTKHKQIQQYTQKSDEYLQSRLNAPEMEELAGLLSASRADLDGRLAKPEGGQTAPVDTKCVFVGMVWWGGQHGNELNVKQPMVGV